MAGWSDSARADTPAESKPASELELESGSHGDVASISDELTDALQAATWYGEAVRKIAPGRPPIVNKRDRDVLALAMSQITRANRAVKSLHVALTARAQD